MKWKKSDLNQYKQAKEYIDTILIPLVPFHLSNDNTMEKSAFQSEVLSVFTNEIENELSGRIMLTPNYSYLKSADQEMEVERLNTWVYDLQKQPFNHVFFVTFDAAWKKNEQAMQGTLVWLPGLHSGDLHNKEMHALIRDQVEQIGELIRSYW
ncbi:hypothetical protein JOC34_000725 [Virgibacillus halotolerans]|uniref:YpiF family protein n=1 Tax=Virgibacillus halotolerans TaxID=1071053 RepID=UPI001961F318|nr:YpiF family protein [Virgibacillus halotolerans]MBM7598368.1 hypothetical protein [Virgibacillus halotolerans]